MNHCSEFDRSYSHVLLYPPQPASVVGYEGRLGSFSARMYGFYNEEQRRCTAAGHPMSESFLVWHRGREYDATENRVRYRGGVQQHGGQKTQVVACRYWYELTDGYWGQFTLTQLPHCGAASLLPVKFKYLEPMKNFVGALEYLAAWRWHAEGVVRVSETALILVSALPKVVDDAGQLVSIGVYEEARAVFPTAGEAFEYLVLLARRDLQYRGFKDTRLLLAF
jgi:hypothetical protein